jgi:hypothetical protein
MANTCAYCGGSNGLPHRSDADCFRELDREIAVAVQHLRALTRRKGQLLRARIRARQRAIMTQPPVRRRLSSPLAARRFGRPTRKR